jgi:chaperonin GroEL (HSP60 family)
MSWPSRAQVGAEIVRRALSYPLKLIANNAGVNGSVVQQKVLETLDANIGYNAATGQYEDLMQSGIIDPTKVRACAWQCEAQRVLRLYSQYSQRFPRACSQAVHPDAQAI